ncbi:hypothetical protein BDF19DRAFT_444535 [Syncephalis fuscata]|nr:hypothetical protein BDF19DRAFT_444535 [Syncephalis fuscata]
MNPLNHHHNDDHDDFHRDEHLALSDQATLPNRELSASLRNVTLSEVTEDADLLAIDTSSLINMENLYNGLALQHTASASSILDEEDEEDEEDEDVGRSTKKRSTNWKKLQSIHSDIDTVRLLVESSDSTGHSDHEQMDSGSSNELDENTPLMANKNNRTRSRSTSRHLSASAAVAALAGVIVRSEMMQQNESEGTLSGDALPNATMYMTIDPEAPDVAYTLTRADGSGYCRLGGNHSWKTAYPGRCWALGKLDSTISIQALLIVLFSYWLFSLWTVMLSK